MRTDRKNKKIAILGAASHIAKGLISNFIKEPIFELHLFVRLCEKKDINAFLKGLTNENGKKCVIHLDYLDFLKGQYDVIINCVGVGTIKKIKGDYTRYFTVTEEYDNLAIKYLKERNPKALYISFSSGTIYGREFLAPANDKAANCIEVNHISQQDYYAIARLNAECKHRAFKDLNIVDLRVFSYFSRYIDLNDGYFITALLKSIRANKIMKTNAGDFMRDYLHPLDLFEAIKKCVNIGKINAALDINSKKPVRKKEIMRYFSNKYGLKAKINKKTPFQSATGQKSFYFSKNLNASQIGYKPKFTSLETIKSEAEFILNEGIK